MSIIDNYNYVICAICGKKGKMLTHHLRVKHELTPKEYKAKYNREHICKEVHEKRSRFTSERNKEWFKNNPEYKEMLREVSKRNGKLPQVQKALQEGAARYARTEEGIAKNRNNFLKLHIEGNLQEKATQGKLNSELYRKQKSEQMSELMTKKWADPEWREQHLDKLKAAYKTPPEIYTLCTGDKVKLRSSWEFKLYDYMVANNVEFEYESLKIFYTGYDGKEYYYIPDFYLRDKNLILEVKPKLYINNKINECKRIASINGGYKFKYVTQDELADLNNFFHNYIYTT